MTYGKRIAELRKKQSMTQADLGSRLNVSAQAVSKWENDLSEPDIESIRKMCEIFEISVDEFLGVEKPKPEEIEKPDDLDEKPKQEVKIISGYCECCKKPVSPGEYTIAHVTYNKSSLTDKVKKSESQHIYCNNCYKTIKETEVKEIKLREKAKRETEKAMLKKNFNRGFIWASIVCVLVSIVFWTTYITAKDKTGLLFGAIFFTISSFTFTAQMFWVSWIGDVMLFFCRSFRAPFGLIFTLDLDGIIWFLTVKLALWIICGLLSIAFFLLGLFITLALSVFNFVFSLIANIRKIREV